MHGLILELDATLLSVVAGRGRRVRRSRLLPLLVRLLLVVRLRVVGDRSVLASGPASTAIRLETLTTATASGDAAGIC